MKEADIDFCKFLLILGLPLSWLLLGSLCCGVWEGIGFLPERIQGTQIRGVATELYCLVFWCYVPLITPFGRAGDKLIVRLRKWLLSGSYNGTNLAQERTFFRLAGVGYGLYFAFRPSIHGGSQQLTSADSLWTLGCVFWFLISMGLSYYFHRDAAPGLVDMEPNERD
jgi:hypothetical protein